jgi:hypothetical protein
MNLRLVQASNAFRIALVLVLIALLPAWTCSGIVQFNSCTGEVISPQINALSPQAISADLSSILLSIDGAGFVLQSEILWNGHPLQTSFVDSHHLEATITQQTLASFGGSAGANVLISVTTPSSNPSFDCENGATSAEITLVID